MEILLLLSTFFTSLLSGTLAVGGGQVLLFILTLVLPVPETMLLHGATQLSSNTTRTLLFRKHLQWRVIGIYALGSLLAIYFYLQMNFIPEKYMIYLFLGFLPLLSLVKSLGKKLSIAKYRNSAFAGSLITFSQVSFGVSGSLIDMFFAESGYNKYKVVANKSITQVGGHIFKIFIYSSVVLAQSRAELQMHWFPICIFGAWLGTFIGKKVLKKLNEENFQKFTKIIICCLSVLLIFKGIQSLPVNLWN